MSRILVVFSGYNQRAVIAFLRCLQKNNIEEEYVIVSSSKEDTIHLTLYSNNVFTVRNHRELDKDEIIQILNSIKNTYSVNELVIVPSTEALNRFMLENRDELEEIGCTIPLVNKVMYQTISDKHSFWQLCGDNQLMVPKNITDYNKYNNPFVAKPKKYFTDNGMVYSPVLVNSEQQYQEFIKNYNVDDFDIQEYIYGESYYLLYYFSKNNYIVKYSQKNLAQQPNGKSILMAEGASIHNIEISEKYENLLKRVNYQGFIMIELRKHKDAFYMIEANPRLWGPSQFIVDSDIPIFEAFLYDYGFLETFSLPETINQETKYLWSTGFKNGVFNDDSCVWYIKDRDIIQNSWDDYFKYDIYHRQDTIDIYNYELAEGD